MDNLNITNDVIEQVAVEKLDAIIAQNTCTIIDVRDTKGIESQGSIPNAVNIPFDTFNEAVDRSHKNYNTVFDRSGPFLFCCTGGVMSYTAAIKAKRSGIKKVFNLDGGHAAWLKHKEVLV